MSTSADRDRRGGQVGRQLRIKHDLQGVLSKQASEQALPSLQALSLSNSMVLMSRPVGLVPGGRGSFRG